MLALTKLGVNLDHLVENLDRQLIALDGGLVIVFLLLREEQDFQHQYTVVP